MKTVLKFHIIEYKGDDREFLQIGPDVVAQGEIIFPKEKDLIIVGDTDYIVRKRRFDYGTPELLTVDIIVEEVRKVKHLWA